MDNSYFSGCHAIETSACKSALNKRYMNTLEKNIMSWKDNLQHVIKYKIDIIDINATA